MTLFQAFSTTAAARGHEPAVVFLDRHTGERTELSFATLHNWVSKMANLLIDDLDVGLGDEVSVDTPLHWMVPITCLAAWATGAAVRVAPGGDAIIGHEADGDTQVDLLVGTGMGGRPLIPDTGDALTVIDVLRQPDDFVDDPGDEGAWVLGARSQATVLAEAQATQVPGFRLLWAADRVDDDLVLRLPRLCTGTGLVLARGFDEEALKKVMIQERAER